MVKHWQAEAARYALPIDYWGPFKGTIGGGAGDRPYAAYPGKGGNLVRQHGCVWVIRGERVRFACNHVLAGKVAQAITTAR